MNTLEALIMSRLFGSKSHSPLRWRSDKLTISDMITDLAHEAIRAPTGYEDFWKDYLDRVEEILPKYLIPLSGDVDSYQLMEFFGYDVAKPIWEKYRGVPFPAIYH